MPKTEHSKTYTTGLAPHQKAKKKKKSSGGSSSKSVGTTTTRVVQSETKPSGTGWKQLRPGVWQKKTKVIAQTREVGKKGYTETVTVGGKVTVRDPSGRKTTEYQISPGDVYKRTIPEQELTPSPTISVPGTSTETITRISYPGPETSYVPSKIERFTPEGEIISTTVFGRKESEKRITFVPETKIESEFQFQASPFTMGEWKPFDTKAIGVEKPPSLKAYDWWTKMAMGKSELGIIGQPLGFAAAIPAQFGANVYEISRDFGRYLKGGGWNIMSPKSIFKGIEEMKVAKAGEQVYRSWHWEEEPEIQVLEMAGWFIAGEYIPKAIKYGHGKYVEWRTEKWAKQITPKGTYQWTTEYVSAKEPSTWQQTLLSSKDISFDQKQYILNQIGGARQYGLPYYEAGVPGRQLQLFPAEFKYPAAEHGIKYTPELAKFPKFVGEKETIEYLGRYMEISRPDFAYGVTIKPPTYQTTLASDWGKDIFKILKTKKGSGFPFQTGIFDIKLEPPKTIVDWESLWGKGFGKDLVVGPKLTFVSEPSAVISSALDTRALLSGALMGVGVLVPSLKAPTIPRYFEDQIAKPIQGQLAKQTQIQEPITVPDVPQITIPYIPGPIVPPNIPGNGGGGGGGGEPAKPFKPLLPTWLSEDKRKKKRRRFAFKFPKQAFKYSSSVEASLFKISGKKPKIITGIEVRPIPGLRRKRKRKR